MFAFIGGGVVYGFAMYGLLRFLQACHTQLDD